MQPQYTPLVFAAYARRRLAFTAEAAATARADEVRGTLEQLLGTEAAAAAVFLGRIGHGPRATARSLRMPLERLRWTGDGERRVPDPTTPRANAA